ncbi:hypothetical protein [Prescottella subtropica]|uniref:hypothetical protein n=1 Tax=Prescottella subtropica TaxID=2545757 RepID=UPI0010F59E80|nr:hypothetical protein [Prescottella subtropica]
MAITPMRGRVQSPPQQTTIPTGPRDVSRDLERLRARSALHAAHLRRTGRPPASPATSRATLDAWRQAASRVSKTAACKDDQDAFMLPDQPDTVSTDSAVLPAATFADLNTEKRYVNARVRAARAAISLCEQCPILAKCRADVLTDIEAGTQPTDAVVAAVAWTSQGLPDPHVHDRVTDLDRDQHSLDALAGTVVYRDDPATNWIPADLEPMPGHDTMLVEAVLSDRNLSTVASGGKSRWVAQSSLDNNPGMRADGREVIPHAEEREIIRQAVAREMAPNTLASLLGCRWDRAADLLHSFGADIPNITPGAAASRHRALWLSRQRHAEQRLEQLRQAQASTHPAHALSA